MEDTNRSQDQREEPDGHAQQYPDSDDFHSLVSEFENADNEGLGRRELGPMTIGHVDFVNGEGAEEIMGFTATRHELLELVRFWFREYMEVRTFCFLYAMSGSTEWRTSIYSQNRLSRLEEAIGTEAFQEVIEQVEKEFESKLGAREWRIFKHGSKEEREMLQDEIQESLTSLLESKKEDGAQGSKERQPSGGCPIETLDRS